MTSYAAPRARRGILTYKGGDSRFPKPISVHYVLPEGDIRGATPVVVMTGAGRNADEYADDWVRAASDEGVVVLVPEFSKADYPFRRDYNAAGMVDSAGDPLPESKWKFDIVTTCVEMAGRQWGTSSKYWLWGHSAGGQFVHRYVMFAQPDDMIGAVAANPVRFTSPDYYAPFPSGLHGAPVDHLDVPLAFSHRFLIILGGDDIEPMGLRGGVLPAESPLADSPLEEGLAFFTTARQYAAAHEVPFRWALQVVPGVGHDHEEMAMASMPWMF